MFPYIVLPCFLNKKSRNERQGTNIDRMNKQENPKIFPDNKI